MGHKNIKNLRASIKHAVSIRYNTYAINVQQKQYFLYEKALLLHAKHAISAGKSTDFRA